METKPFYKSWTNRLAVIAMAVGGLLLGLERTGDVPPGTADAVGAVVEQVGAAAESTNSTVAAWALIVTSILQIVQRFRPGAGGRLS